MGVLSSLLNKRDHPSRVSDRILALFDQGYETASGAHVTPESSLQVTAVYACVRVLAEVEAGLPFVLYRRVGRGKERAADHPLYSKLHDAPNPEMTAYEFREAMTGHTALRGNAYAEIEWSTSGVVRNLWPLRPDRTEPERVNGVLAYVVTMPDGSKVRLPAWRVLHLRGFSSDGIRGYNPIWLARQSIGLAMATEEFGARLFGNGAKPGGILEHPGKLSKEAQDRLRSSIEDRHQGLSNAHRMMILEEGMSWKQVGMAPEDAQFLQTRNYQVVDIARLFNMKPHKIAELTNATFSNIEHEGLDFVVSTMRPWFVRWEQRAWQSLLSTSEQKQYYAEHLVDALLRGDTASRYTAYQTAILSGFMTRNEVRDRENLNPIDGLDEALVPLNMVEASAAGAAPDMTQTDGNRQLPAGDAEKRAVLVAETRQSLGAAQLELLEDVAARITRRETADIGRAVDKYLVRGQDVAGFLLWLDEFYQAHAEFVERNMRPPLAVIGRLVLAQVARELEQDGLSEEEAQLLDFVDEYVAGLGQRWAASGRNQITKIVRDAGADGNEDAAAKVQKRLDAWEETQPAKVARREATRSVNAFAVTAYLIGGVTFLRWVARGENCPYCRALNGKVVGIKDYFMDGGTEFKPDGADEALLVRRRVKHPPIHDGCDCQITAVKQ